MLRKFKITIDGKEYLVEMEEIGGVPQPVTPVPPVAAATPMPEPQPAAPTPAPSAPVVSTGDTQGALEAPMPGTIFKILVNVGDTVKTNQPVMILEAMKMENEIVATQDGTVKAIHVSQGAMVNPGDPLLTIS